MDVTNHIAELLSYYECVVLPGFGGFIVDDRPATVNRINHQFKPPFRKIMLNVHLKANDGLLVNHISNSNSISYQEARAEVDRFVNIIKEKLEKRESFTFDNIGRIRFDQDKNVIFEQNTSINYNPNAFGLSGFISPPIKRVTDEEKLRSIIAPKKSEPAKPVDRKPELFIAKEKEKKSRKPIVLITIVILLLLSIGWGIFNPDKVNTFLGNMIAVIPTVNDGVVDNNVINEARYIPRKLVESDEDILAKIEALNNTEKEAVEEISKEDLIEESDDLIDLELPAEKPDNKIEQLPPKVENTSPLYYIIAGSFSNIENAERLVANLKMKGHEAQIADTNSNGMYRVAYAGIENLAAAKQKLYAIRQDDNSEAWIFRK